MSDNNQAMMMSLQNELASLKSQMASLSSNSFAENSRDKRSASAIESLNAQIELLKEDNETLRNQLAQFVTKQSHKADMGKVVSSISEAMADLLHDSETLTKSEILQRVERDLSSLHHKADVAQSIASASTRSAADFLRSTALTLTL